MPDKAEIQIGGDYDDLSSTLDQAEAQFKSFGDSVRETGEGADETWKKVGETLEAVVTTLRTKWDEFLGWVTSAFEDLWADIKEGTKAFIDTQAQVLRLSQTMRSLRSDTGFTIDQLERMNLALQKISVNGAEAVRNAQLALMQFKNVKGDVFANALKAAADLGAVTGRDLASAAEHLGRMLENPIKGLEDLVDEGVKFTKVQRNMIMQMIRANNVLGLQRAILSKLSELYGRFATEQANTLKGQLQRLDNAFQRIYETLGSLLVPTLNSRLIPLFEKVGKVVAYLVDRFGKSGDMLGRVFDRGLEIAEKALYALLDAGARVFSFLQAASKDWAAAWSVAWAFTKVAALSALASTLEALVAWSRLAMDAGKPFFVWAAAQWKAFAKSAVAGMKLVVGVFDAGWRAIQDAAKAVWDSIGETVVDWSLKTIGAVTFVGVLTYATFSAIKDMVMLVWNAGSLAVTAFVKVVSTGFSVIGAVIGFQVKLWNATVGAAWRFLWEGAKWALGGVAEFFGLAGKAGGESFGLLTKVIGLVYDAVSTLLIPFKKLFDFIFDGLKSLGIAVVDKFRLKWDDAMAKADRAMAPVKARLAELGKRFDDIKDKFDKAFAMPAGAADLDKLIDDLRVKANAVGGDAAKNFDDFMNKFGGNLRQNRAALDKLIDNIKKAANETPDVGEPGPFGKPRLPSEKDKREHGGHESRVGEFEDLVAMNRRIQGAAFKSAEVSATEKQTSLMQKWHDEDREDAAKIVAVIKPPVDALDPRIAPPMGPDGFRKLVFDQSAPTVGF
jgi:hypothetical protein